MLADQIPRETLDQHLQAIFRGKCPKCSGEGPIDIHTSYFVWSILILTSWENTPNMCCKSCGVKGQALSALGSLFLGWWGFPWGIIMTPVQVARNIAAIFRSGDPDTPSEELKRQVKLLLAEHIIMSSNRNDQNQLQAPDGL